MKNDLYLGAVPFGYMPSVPCMLTISIISNGYYILIMAFFN